jgi:hypothetical protein
VVQYRRTVEVLAVSEYLKQLGPAVDLCNALAAVDINSASSGAGAILDASGGGAAVKEYYDQFAASLRAESVPELTSGCNQPFTAIFARYQDYLQHAEASLHALLLPTPPFHAWVTPPLGRMLCSVQLPAVGVSSSAAHTADFAPEDETLVAEHLLHMLSLTVGVRDVRLSSSSGAEHVVLPHCLAAEDVHRVVQQWREAYIQHESLVTQRHAAKRLAERAAKNAATTTTAAANATLPEEFAPFAAESEYETPIVSQSTVNSATTLSLDTYALLKRAHVLLQIDLSCVTRDYLRRIIAWLSDDLQLMYEVTKPGDYAFSALQRFYCPRHPWEVRCCVDMSNGGEFCMVVSITVLAPCCCLIHQTRQ